MYQIQLLRRVVRHICWTPSWIARLQPENALFLNVLIKSDIFFSWSPATLLPLLYRGTSGGLSSSPAGKGQIKKDENGDTMRQVLLRNTSSSSIWNTIQLRSNLQFITIHQEVQEFKEFKGLQFIYCNALATFSRYYLNRDPQETRESCRAKSQNHDWFINRETWKVYSFDRWFRNRGTCINASLEKKQIPSLMRMYIMSSLVLVILKILRQKN